MRILSLLVLLVFMLNDSICQNYIIDGGFEEFDSCPEMINDFDVKYWHVIKDASYLNHCGYDVLTHFVTGDTLYNPDEIYEGDGMASLTIDYPLSVGYDVKYRNYITGQLKSPLSGKTFVSMQINTQPGYVGTVFQARFSNRLHSSELRYPILLEPQLEFDGFIGGEGYWKEYKGCVDLDSTVQYVTFGNYMPHGSSFQPHGLPGGGRRLFIDDVQIYKIPERAYRSIRIDPKMKYYLPDTLQDFKVNYLLGLDTIVSPISFDTKGEYIIKAMIDGCTDIIEEITFYVNYCDADLSCSNISKLENGIIDLKCIDDDGSVDIQKLVLYNRWGAKFELEKSSEYSFRLSEEVDIGVYIAEITYEKCGEVKKIHSDITIVK